MDFYTAKAQLEEEERLRSLRFEKERKERLAAGCGDTLDKLLEQAKDLIEKPYSRYNRSYGALRRISSDVKSGWYYRRLKSLAQRAKRGYGETDLWNLSSYLDNWVPQALRELKHTHAGYPAIVYDHDGTELYNLGFEISVDESDKCSALWEKTLERMALGFDAHAALIENGWQCKTQAELELQRIFKEGMALLVYNYDALWD
jgi:hypothetical protein